MISISSLFESPEPYPRLVFLRRDHRRALNQNQQDALGWYSRSVSAVRQGIERGGVDAFVGLITCLLFICMEALLGSSDETLRLHNQGVRLILTLQAEDACGALSATKSALLKDTIVPLFVRLGTVSLNTGGLMADLLRETECAPTQEFDSLKSAREAVIMLAAEVHLFESACEEDLLKSHADRISQELADRQQTLSARLQSWHIAFTNLMQSLCSKGALPPLQLSTGALLLTYYEMLSVMLAVCASPSRITTDACIQNFQNITEQSSIALSSSTQGDGTQPPFTFEISAGLPLWFTSVRCREPAIRRTALALLRRAHQVEGFYKRDDWAIFGERVMMLEETYEMVMNAAPSTTNLTPPKSTNGYIEYQPHRRGISDSSSPISMDSKFVANPYPSPAESETRTPAAELVPEEARIRPLGIFRPRDGYPPGATEEDIAKWGRSRDHLFLRFSRNECDQSSNTWKTIYGYVPVDF
ncbi:finger domain protein [Aspergillus sp. HF37]|nr:finger domain protein [Aspergillus sp. HF37]